MAIYIKSLDIYGFKSFNTRTRIEFSEGITGIVGPNGCGKSNIIESIKWVLGEQSIRSLRGNKVPDIIFGGTQYRPSSGMADVSLTFNNELKWLSLDFPEVCIGRRVFRSGENQYFINGTKSKLKETTELFLDTGVGKDSYAIFEQGKIDKLLSESPMDRRVLFEDFSGISKIKFRKEEAEKKLSQAQENLQKIQEILSQREEEVKKLGQQSLAAENFQSVNNRLKEKELHFETLRIKNMRNDILNRSNKIEALREEIFPLSQKNEGIEANLLELDQQIEAESCLFSKKNKDNLVKEKELSECEIQYIGSKRILEEKILRKKDLELMIEQSKVRIDDWENLLLEKNDALTVAEKTLVSNKKTFHSLETQLLSLKDNLSKKEEEMLSKYDLSLSIEDLKKDITSFEDQYHKIGAQQSINKSDLSRTSIDIAKHKAYSDQILSELDIQTKKFAGLQKGHSELEKKIANKNSSIQEIEKKLDGFEKENQDLSKKTKNLDQHIIDSIDQLLKQIESFDKIFGSQQEKLHAIFSEISQLTKKAPTQKTIESFRNLLKEIDKTYITMIHGIFGKNSFFTDKINLLHKQESIAKEIKISKKNLETLFLEKQEIEKNFSISLKTIIECESSVNSMKKEESKIATLIKDLSQQEKLLLSKEKTLDLDLENIVQNLEKFKSILSENEIFMSSNQNQIIQIQSDFSEAKINLNSSEIILASLKKEILSIKERKDDFIKLQEKNSEELSECSNSINALNEEILELESEKDSLEYELTQLRLELERNSSNIESLKNEKTLLEKEHRQITSNINEIKIRESELLSSVSERKYLLSQTESSFQEQYQIDIETIDIPNEATIENLNQEIRDLRTNLAKIGNVNLLALEQLQDVKEIANKLSHQKNDVEQAIGDILKLIRDTNKDSSRKFLLAFDEIRKAFQDLFSDLFNGGRADLIMTDPNNPLTSGIEILAEPPGQKFQNINLLSGGQRAMVAISVIFAILELKPKPFVILDEIDAPLDDENIERFKKLLKKFKKTCQFILVSHSKSTLEVCDTLFGITMEELGCSKILSVAFDEKENLLFV